MSSSRAQANHRLYLAKIQLSAWRRELAAQDIPAITLGQAFQPAVREHLLDAYGWYLLAVTGMEADPAALPRSCAELPPVAEGKAVPGEIREFQQLERDGWLAELLSPLAPQAGAASSSFNLASTAPVLPDTERAGEWIQRLETLFDRMGDSLDEY